MNDDSTSFANVVQFRPFQLYRLFDSRQNLLYVGITQQFPPEKRFKQHSKDKRWWYRVVERYTTMTALRTMDRSKAEALERSVIIDERPRFNVTHQEKRSRYADAGHGFQCSQCDWLAFMVIASSAGTWSAACRRHEPDRESPDLFNFDTGGIDSGAELAKLIEHLTPKPWFNFDAFMTFLLTTYNAEAC